MAVTSYIDSMTIDKSFSCEAQKIKKLEFSVDELVRICERLQLENSQLRHERAEQGRLAEKNHLARDQVERMITRLKHMESEL